MEEYDPNLAFTNAIAEIELRLSNDGDKIRPLVMARIIYPFIEAVNQLSATDPSAVSEMMAEYQDVWCGDAIGQLLRGLPILHPSAYEDRGNPEAPIDKHLAVDVARELGPDWAQAWYRFIVLVTKLA